MSQEALSPAQFPRTGDIHEPHVSAVVSQVEPGHHYLRNLRVSDEHRGKGIGTQFMQSLIKEHDAAGSKLTLHTGQKRLEKWYGSMGFKSEGEDILGTRMTRPPRES